MLADAMYLESQRDVVGEQRQHELIGPLSKPIPSHIYLLFAFTTASKLDSVESHKLKSKYNPPPIDS